MRWFKLLIIPLMLSSKAVALPTGIAEVYSTYTDTQTKEIYGIGGYGTVYKLNFALLDKPVFVVQTASHLSQGGLFEEGVPRIAVRLPLKSGKTILAYPKSKSFSETLRGIVSGDELFPIIAGSYFANGKDSEVLILEPGEELEKELTHFVEMDISADNMGVSRINPEAWALDPNDKTWRLKKIRDRVATICPTKFSTCAIDDTTISSAPGDHRLFQLIGDLGLIQTEYDWLIFSRTNQGMSGLPLIVSDGESIDDRAKTGVLGAISSSSKISAETWVTYSDPANHYGQWLNIRATSRSDSPPEWVGEQDIIWERVNGILRRRLTGLSHVYIEAENSATSPVEGDAKSRCDNGGAFRFDNGGAFRFDNGSSLCDGPVSADITSGFKVLRADGSFYNSNLLIIEHPSYTRIVAPTVAGMTLSQYTKDFELHWRQQGLHTGMNFTEYLEDERKVRWQPFKVLFNSFYKSETPTSADQEWLLKFNPYAKQLTSTKILKFTSPLGVAKVLRTRDGQNLSKGKGQITLYPYVDVSDTLIGVFVHIHLEGKDLMRWVSFSQHPGLPADQFFEPYIQVKLDGQPGMLELVGILTHNPDRMNIPELYPTGRVVPVPQSALFVHQPLQYSLELVKGDGDPSMCTIFTLHSEDATYYMYIP